MHNITSLGFFSSCFFHLQVLFIPEYNLAQLINKKNQKYARYHDLTR